jgi:NADPH-dependent curcumin reductase
MVLNRLNKGARIAICGAISQYNAASKEEVFAPKNYMSLLVNSASMRGFVVFDFASQYKEAVEKLKVPPPSHLPPPPPPPLPPSPRVKIF